MGWCYFRGVKLSHREQFTFYHEWFTADVLDRLTCSLVIKLKIDDYASTIAQQILRSKEVNVDLFI